MDTEASPKSRQRTNKKKTKTSLEGLSPYPTQAESRYARDLDHLLDLGLHETFLTSRVLVRQLLHCFGFHKDSEQPFETGLGRVDNLRKFYFESSDPEWLARKLNGRIDDIQYWLTADDIDFMIKILSTSEHPLKEEHPGQDPEDLQFHKEINALQY